jgi:hypothetical protein
MFSGFWGDDGLGHQSGQSHYQAGTVFFLKGVPHGHGVLLSG